MFRKRYPDILTKGTWLRIAALFFVIFNVGIFIAAARKPVVWQHLENTYREFFYSRDMDQADVYALKSGLHLNDFLKPLRPFHLEGGGLRFRPFAHLVDMLFIKLWQSLGIVSFKNYSLIILHVLNAFLLWRLLARITLEGMTSLIAAFLFLNSLIAFSTLLYPFQITKILLVTLFLASWLIVLDDSRTCRVGPVLFFCFLALLGLFTDEQAVFIFYIPLIYIFWRRRDKACLRVWFWGLGGLLVSFFLLIGILKAAAWRLDGPYQLDFMKEFFPLFIRRLIQPVTYVDSLRSFVFYFLARHFGYWGRTGFGIIGFLTTVSLIGFVFRNRGKFEPLQRAALLLVLLVIIKTFLAGHLAVHPGIMPRGTVFPSLLFFSYYYPYVDSMLLTLAFGLGLAPILQNNLKRAALLFLMVSIFNLSHFIYIKEGIRGPLALLHQKKEIKAYADILVLKSALETIREGPVYASFPAGRQSCFKFYMDENSSLALDPAWPVGAHDMADRLWLYDAIILVKFLRPLEKGDLIVSLENVKPPYSDTAASELRWARYFIDLPKRVWLDLDRVKAQAGKAAMIPKTITQKYIKELAVPPESDNKRYLVFVKGAAEIIIHTAQRSLNLKQTYGNSYQLFDLSLDDADFADSIRFEISPADKDPAVQIIGPFIF